MGSLHNTRFLRFLIVLGTVVLTIFLYASYSSNASYTPQLRSSMGSGIASSSISSAAAAVGLSYMSAQSLQQPQQQGKHTNSTENEIAYNANSIQSHTAKLNKKSVVSLGAAHVTHAKKHREPTIDVDAVGGGISGNAGNGLDEVPDDVSFISNDLLEEQYGQNVENVLGNINNASSSAGIADLQQLSIQQQSDLQQQQQQILQQDQQQIQQNQLIDNNLNKIPDSDVLIPTSNLQKFIETADKILKNITVAPSPLVLAAAGGDNGAPGDDGQAATANKISAKNEPARAAEKPLEESSQQKQSNTKLKDRNNSNDDAALPPSAVMIIKHGIGSVEKSSSDANLLKSSHPTPKVKLTPKPNATSTSVVDPIQGIQTQRIYESGHLNEEINVERLCPKAGADLKLLILITSAQSHADARLSIRQTWGHYGIRRDVTTAFILGRTTNESLNLALQQENFIYGDLIRGNFIDSYNNLTLKTVSALEWVDVHCSRAKYVLKTDDDMFINVPKLLAFLDSHAKEKRVIFGRLAKKWKPIRNKKSKYYVSTGQFGAPVFPPFTTGPAYVLSQDIIHELYVRALLQVYLKLEDVFTTGIVAQELGIKRVHVNEFLNRRIAFNPCNIRKTISVHMIKANEQFDLWKKLLDQTTKCK